MSLILLNHLQIKKMIKSLVSKINRNPNRKKLNSSQVFNLMLNHCRQILFPNKTNHLSRNRQVSSQHNLTKKKKISLNKAQIYFKKHRKRKKNLKNLSSINQLIHKRTNKKLSQQNQIYLEIKVNNLSFNFQVHQIKMTTKSLRLERLI